MYQAKSHFSGGIGYKPNVFPFGVVVTATRLTRFGMILACRFWMRKSGFEQLLQWCSINKSVSKNNCKNKKEFIVSGKGRYLFLLGQILLMHVIRIVFLECY